MGGRADGQNDEQVPQDGDQVYGQEEAEDGQMQSWIICYSKKKKICNICYVSGFYIASGGNMERNNMLTPSAAPFGNM